MQTVEKRLPRINELDNLEEKQALKQRLKSQKQNEGELKEITVKIEKKVAEDFELMMKNTGMPIADLVVIAMKRFRSSHLDYLKQVPMTE